MTNIAPILKLLIKRFGLENRMVESILTERWNHIVGKNVASHTQPYKIKFRRLYLYVDNPIWMHQLSFLKDEIVKKVNSFIGRNIISNIYLTIGTIEDRASTLKKREEVSLPSPKALTPDELSSIEEILRPIKDNRVKDGMRRVIIKSLSYPPSILQQ